MLSSQNKYLWNWLFGGEGKGGNKGKVLIHQKTPDRKPRELGTVAQCLTAGL